jgi:hypothetical protein
MGAESSRFHLSIAAIKKMFGAEGYLWNNTVYIYSKMISDKQHEKIIK